MSAPLPPAEEDALNDAVYEAALAVCRAHNATVAQALRALMIAWLLAEGDARAQFAGDDTVSAAAGALLKLRLGEILSMMNRAFRECAAAAAAAAPTATEGGEG